MLLNYILLIGLGPLIALFVLYLLDDRQKSERYFEEQHRWHLEG